MSTTPLNPPPAPQAAAARKPVTLHRLAQMRAAGEKIAMLTCYDACFARALDEAGVDMLLVGDSLGMVLQGRRDTLGVSVDEMAYHVRCVAAGVRAAMVAVDMPFGSYQGGPQQALDNAVRLMAAGAQMVKLEGGAWLAPTVRFLVERGVPVCAHVGFTPQSLHLLGGYRVQGRDDASAQRLQDDADALAEAGAAIVLMEMVPAALAARVTERLAQPTAARAAVATIGIGAGRDCSGQVLVLHDMLGIATGVRPRFVRDFLAGCGSVDEAIRAYVAAVKTGAFPGPEHAF